jgi:hypothetical protein
VTAIRTWNQHVSELALKRFIRLAITTNMVTLDMIRDLDACVARPEDELSDLLLPRHYLRPRATC